MLPILYHFTFESGLSRAILYLLALAALGYGGWIGWSGTLGEFDRKRGVHLPPTRSAQLQRTAIYLVVVAGMLWFGLGYVLPADALFGGKGEGIPLHTYGLLMALGFLLAVKVAGALSAREWATLEPTPVAVQQWIDSANAAIQTKAPAPALPEVVRPYRPFMRRARDGQLSLPADFNLEGARARDRVTDLAFWALVGGIGGSKLLFILVNWQDYAGEVGAFLGGLFTFRLGQAASALGNLVSGGLVFYGGLIGAVVLSFLWARRSGLNFLRVADVAIPTVSLGQALGRLGCFSAGCCWGGTTHAGHPLAVQFPGMGHTHDVVGNLSQTPSLAWSSMSRDGRYVLEATGEVVPAAGEGVVRMSDWVISHGHTLPVYATQLMESLGQIALFVLLVTARRWRRFHGMIFGIWLMAYAILRSTVELFRGDAERGTLHGLVEAVPLEAWYNISTSQFISLALFGFGAALLWTRWNATRSQTALIEPVAEPPAKADAA